jgi:DNA primase
MRIPDSKIREVASAADIVQVISGYVDLKRAGKDYRGLCPFHGDKDPSFYVSPQKEIFYCFGCAAGGSVFNFLMKMENISFVESVRSLAGRYGIAFEISEASTARDGAKKAILKALDVAQSYFVEKLGLHSSPRAYLTDRGIDREWAAKLDLGFAQESWEDLYRHLRNQGVKLNDAVSAGLIRRRSNGDGYHDYFRSRITIPIRDLNGSLVAFGGRILGAGEPKYLNSPESAVFSKKYSLFGLDSAREAVRREGKIILVEGYFDQISLRMIGLENVVAPLGTSLTKEQVRLIKRFCDEVITVFDSDEAGLRAVKRAIPIFLAEGIEPRCLILEEDKDPDEAVRRVGADGFRRMLDNSVPMIDFFLEDLREHHDVSTLKGRDEALKESLPVLREIAHSKEGDYLIERFSSRIRVREEFIRRELSARPGLRREKPAGQSEPRKTLFDFPADERIVVRGMLQREGFLERVLETGLLKDLEDPLLRRLAEMIVSFRDKSEHFEAASFCNAIEDQSLASTVAGWLNPSREEDEIPDDEDGDLLLVQTLERMLLRRLEKRVAEIQERMQRCEPCDDEYNSLAVDLMDVTRKLHRGVKAK